jgi:methylated-DNA-[protein]-cysteine S-methyltransferase
MAFKPLKETLRQLLEDGKLEEVAEIATGRKRTLGSLIALTFDADLQVGWRSIESMGLAVERLSRRSPGYVKDHMRRLYWLITEESGGIFWRAPECMAECSARLPELLHDFIPIAFHLLETLEDEDLGHFRPGALWAVGRLSGLAGNELESVLPLVRDALSDRDPQARGMAVWCLDQAGEGDCLVGRGELLEDDGPVDLYEERVVHRTTVAELTRRVLPAAPAPS